MRRAVAIGLVVLAVAGLAVPFLRGIAPLDLQVYLAGGRGVREGLELYGPQVRVQGYGFTYPPFAALVFAPAALLPFGVAVWLMFAVSLAGLGLIVRVAAPSLVPAATRHALPALGVVAALLCEPVRVTVWNGQINLVLVALLAVDHRLPSTSRWRGVATGIATAIKLTPGLFVLLFVLERDRRAFVRSLATALACAGLAAVVAPDASRHFWLHGLFDRENLGDTARTGNQSLYALAERTFADPAAVRVTWMAAALVVLAVAGYVLHRLLADGRRLLAWSVTGIVACLVSPVSWTHHWVWCVPLVVALVPMCRPSRAGRVALSALAVLFVIGCNKPPLSLTFGNPAGRAVVGNLYVLAALAVLAVLAVRTVRTMRAVRAARTRTVPLRARPRRP